MPSSEQKRQKKLAKKQAKTKKRLSDIAKRKQALTSYWLPEVATLLVVLSVKNRLRLAYDPFY